MDTSNQSSPTVQHSLGPSPSDPAFPTSSPPMLNATPNAHTVPLSKNALKKAKKAERFAALKLERRAREKEAKKQKKRERAEKREGGELDENESILRQAKRARVAFGGVVVVDLGFDDKMSEKEITSLCSQLAYTYSANRNASFPFSLIFSSLGGRTLTRLESLSQAAYKRWAHTEWWHQGYERLWLRQVRGLINVPIGEDTAGPSLTVQNEGDNTEVEASKSHEDGEPTQDIRQRVVYLTADAEDELTELKPDEVYIIGGICDHNRYKNLCLNKAIQSRIRTARLPIGRYLASLPTRKVLTVNQVFEILVKWVETKDWEEALYSIVPKRKFNPGGKDHKSDTIHDDEVQGGNCVDDAEKTDDETEPVKAQDPTIIQEVELE